MTLPTVHVIATGGTIAGVAASSTSRDYVAGAMPIGEILAQMSELSESAHITSEQLVNLDSVDVSHADWLKLAKAVTQALMRSEVSGLVITHGTDSLEETAYFLDLLFGVSQPKPIVLVGAMRSASALSADGPINLFNAVAIARHAQSHGLGVTVLMNDSLFSARQVTKAKTSGVDAFDAKDGMPIAQVSMGQPRWISRNSSPKGRAHLGLDVSDFTRWPRVQIMTCYIGFDPQWLWTQVHHKTCDGLILAGMGSGNLPQTLAPSLQLAQQQRMPIVRTTRVPSGAVTPNYNHLDQRYGLIQSGYLSAVKSRILLMLALIKTNDITLLERLFNQEGAAP